MYFLFYSSSNNDFLKKLILYNVLAIVLSAILYITS